MFKHVKLKRMEQNQQCCLNCRHHIHKMGRMLLMNVDLDICRRTIPRETIYDAVTGETKERSAFNFARQECSNVVGSYICKWAPKDAEQ